MSQEIPFPAVLEALLDDSRPFPARYLHRFSDLPPVEVKSLLEAWPKISLRRKQTLLEDLEELAESDTLTNFDDLARPLLQDPDPQIRILAIRLLWECEDAKLVPAYMDILGNDENAEVRAAAANALGLFISLGELDKIPSETQHRIEEQLFKVLSAKEPVLVRRRALESLGYSSREEVAPLIEKAYRENHEDWLASALFAMGRSYDERWKKHVLSKLLHPSDDVRAEAIHAAGELEISSARSILLDLLEDEEDREIRREIIWALSKIGGEGVRSRLEELLEAAEDDEEAEFIEEAQGNLLLTEDTGFDMFSVDSEPDLDDNA